MASLPVEAVALSVAPCCSGAKIGSSVAIQGAVLMTAPANKAVSDHRRQVLDIPFGIDGMLAETGRDLILRGLRHLQARAELAVGFAFMVLPTATHACSPIE
jgi:hypothetical protein